MLDTHAHNPQHIHKQRLATRKRSSIVFILFLGGINHVKQLADLLPHMFELFLFIECGCADGTGADPPCGSQVGCVCHLRNHWSQGCQHFCQDYICRYTCRCDWCGLAFFFFSRLQESSECMFTVHIIRLNYWEIGVLLSEFQRTLDYIITKSHMTKKHKEKRTLDYKVSSQNLTWPKKTTHTKNSNANKQKNKAHHSHIHLPPASPISYSWF